MSVKRDPRTGGWFFRTTVKFADGTKKRIFGTPGVPGRFHDLPNTKVGAAEAERRAISEALHGQPIATAQATATKEAPKKINEHSNTFLENYKPEQKPGEKREKRRVLESHLLPFFGEMTIEQLKQTDVDAFSRAELNRGMAVKTVNNRLAVLSTMIKYVTGQKSKLRFKLSGLTAEIRCVDPAEVEKLLAASDDVRYRVVVLLAAEAGLRVGEIRGLQWTDIKAGQLTVRRALDKLTNESIAPKHNKTRTVPLSPRLAESLEQLSRSGLWVVAEVDGSYVTYDRLSETINALYQRAEVKRPPKPVHCLRHTFGTVMAKSVPLPVLRDLMGHSDVQTTLRYIDVGEDQKRDAIAAVFGRGSQVAANDGTSEHRSLAT
jgi:integrase